MCGNSKQPVDQQVTKSDIVPFSEDSFKLGKIKQANF